MNPEPRETVTQTGSVTPERFAKVRAIFEAAIERPVSDRRGFVDGACGNDEELRREVQAMLVAEGIGDPLLDGKPPSSAPEEGRFPAGTVLAGRYRILGLLGKGGMGEVYKAFDLILNQTVALKFLSARGFGEAALVRFRNEVRIARQVSHPNVCRVYDLGMVEGLHFLSMEYIDGEDLASLLRRIGRLPQDKAIEFTRKICAGLSAAHERGVLHRDLKPANIMIDGRGQVRITDFGLAALAVEIPLSDLRSGTPAYMSPEQKAGKEVTTRSDIYSLGLVLHEMFTGKARKDSKSTPSDLVKDLDPAIERLILRCLEEDPKRRPQTSLNIAMALPGADPIAAALAAGETPSPEMVAASSEKEGLTPRMAMLSCAALLFFLIVQVLSSQFSQNGALLARAPLDTPPEALAFRAQELLRGLGYVEPTRHTAFGFTCCDTALLDFLEQQGPARDAILATHQPPVMSFWYRQHQDEFLVSTFPPVGISYDDPANTQPGMIRLQLDAKGRLTAFEARPATQGSRAPAKSPDWTAVLAAAGLDPARFQQATPEQIPPVAFDARMAWVGSYSDHPPERMRVEAASWEGRLVALGISGNWKREPPGFGNNLTLGSVAALSLFSTLLIGAVLVAWRNLQTGRGDRKGASNIACVAFALTMLSWIIGGPHFSGPGEFRRIIETLSWAAFQSGVIWSLYVAIEPYVRRHWPDALISSTRLQAGRIRDPLVASHVLVGSLLFTGIMAMLPGWTRVLGSGRLGVPNINALNSVPEFVSLLVRSPVESAFLTMAMLLLVVLLRLLFRRVWIADLIACVLMGAPAYGFSITSVRDYAVVASFAFLSTLLTLWQLRRFGLLPVATSFFLGGVVSVAPLSLSTWYNGRSLVALSIPAVIATWALWVILTTRRKRSIELEG